MSQPPYLVGRPPNRTDKPADLEVSTLRPLAKPCYLADMRFDHEVKPLHQTDQPLGGPDKPLCGPAQPFIRAVKPADLEVSDLSHTDKATYLALFHPHFSQKTQQKPNKPDILCQKMTSYPRLQPERPFRSKEGRFFVPARLLRCRFSRFDNQANTSSKSPLDKEKTQI